MSNIRERMRNQTAGLRSTTEVADSEISDPSKRTEPRTAPGRLGALQDAQARIAELEKQLEGSSVLLVDKMEPNPWQPRKKFNAEEMDELANGIREVGLIQPIVVRVNPGDPSRYQIVAGERRWRAHKMLGLQEIKAHVVDLTDSEMAIHALIENINRVGLTDYEVSLSVARMEKEFPSRKQVSEALGISKSQLHRLAAFAKLPEYARADLDDRPALLGANAASAIVQVFNQHPDGYAEAFESLWVLLKQGEIDQTKFAPLLTDKLTTKTARVSASQHVRSFYKQGKKAGYLSRDSSNFVIRLKTSILTDEQEKDMYAFLERMFPQA